MKTEQDLEAFVESDVHQEAILKGMPALTSTRFYRSEIEKESIPIPWEKAEELLRTKGRNYD